MTSQVDQASPANQASPVNQAGTDTDEPAASLLERPGVRRATALWALFAGLTLLLAATGLAGSLVGVRGVQLGFPTWLLGLMSGAYYLGFLGGSRLAGRLVATVGHVRVYTALAGLATTALLLHALSDRADVWVAARSLLGLAMAGQYVVAESWMNGLATNEVRARLLSAYMWVCALGWALGQALLPVAAVDAVAGFVVAGLLCAIATVPVALAETVVPRRQAAGSMSLRELARLAPSGVGAALLVGVAHGTLLGLGATFGARMGLSASRVAWFMLLPTVGQLLLQWPIGAASDDVDRRAVGAAAALTAALAAVGVWALGPTTIGALGAMLVLGGMSYPLYAVAVAVTNDWVEPQRMNAVATVLVTLYGVGAAIGPLVGGAVMSAVGPEAWVWTVATIHLVIAVFLIYRLLAWRAPLVTRPWSELSVPARAFALPVMVLARGRRVGADRRHD